jgi:hypothetical protein
MRMCGAMGTDMLSTVQKYITHLPRPSILRFMGIVRAPPCARVHPCAQVRLCARLYARIQPPRPSARLITMISTYRHLLRHSAISSSALSNRRQWASMSLMTPTMYLRRPHVCGLCMIQIHTSALLSATWRILIRPRAAVYFFGANMHVHTHVRMH